MRTSLAALAALGVALASCQQAPADGTTETPAPAETTEAPTDIAVPAETAPKAPGTPDLGFTGPVPTPIRIGTNGPQTDSCPGYGEVSGLNSDGGNYLSVRDAPSTQVKERDRIGNGHKVNVCAEKDGWYGIVYAIEGDSVIDCEVDSPVDTPRNYTGPCAQGWVNAKFVTITAG